MRFSAMADDEVQQVAQERIVLASKPDENRCRLTLGRDAQFQDRAAWRCVVVSHRGDWAVGIWSFIVENREKPTILGCEQAGGKLDHAATPPPDCQNSSWPR